MAFDIEYNLTDTIYALSSGPGKGGVAVIRVSGPESLYILKTMTDITEPKPRYAYFKPLKNKDGVELDNALILYFKGPNSFTGEDVVELQVHGGAGVIDAVFEALSQFKNTRPASKGEFSRRAVVYGKMDLTSAEGLMDLIDAVSEKQRQQALTQMQGALATKYEKWRKDLVHHMGYLEAFIDFPEEDIPPEKLAIIDSDIAVLIDEIQTHLQDDKKGQRLRSGFQIALIGKPNVGKSSLINALSQKDVAIVSTTAGTTRDVVEVHLTIDGFPVVLADTAGLREQAGDIEAEGIKRAVRKAEESDLILYVQDSAHYPTIEPLPDNLKNLPVKIIWNKTDLHDKSIATDIAISAKSGIGVDLLWDEIKLFLKEHFSPSTTGAITRERYRVALNECLFSLQNAVCNDIIELKAEDLRLSARALGRIMGRIDTDELLDVIFRDFCIGK